MARFRSQEISTVPPNIYNTLYTMLLDDEESRLSSTKFPTAMNLVNQLHGQRFTSSSPSFLPITNFVLKLFDILKVSPLRYQDVVSYLSESLSDKSEFFALKLEKLPEGLIVIVMEAIVNCQENTPTNWGIRELEFVGRRDLQKLVSTSLLSSVDNWKRKNVVSN